MPALADIAFDCPHCKGPLMAQADHVGLACECPHCYAQLEVPDGSPVNKDSFVEPSGLRRILQKVRDREWETLRRKLRAAVARSTELESELQRAHTALASVATTPEPSDDKGKEIEHLRRQLSEVGDKFAMANQAFMAGRKQQDTVIEQMRRELETCRGETQGLRKRNEELARKLQAAQQKLESALANAGSADEILRLQQELAAARTQLTEARCQLDAEQAKVVLMEAAAIGVDESAGNPAALVEDLKLQVAAFRKDNASLRSARDKAHAEAEKLKTRLSSTADLDEVESALARLQDGLSGVRELISQKKAAKG